MKTKIQSLIAATFIPLLCCATTGHADNSILPGEIWPAATGNTINAHGGGILFHNGTYYWYGEFKEGRTWSPRANRS